MNTVAGDVTVVEVASLNYPGMLRRAARSGASMLEQLGATVSAYRS